LPAERATIAIIMLEHSEGSTSRSGGKAVSRHVPSPARRDRKQAGLSEGGDQRPVSCDVQNGVPMVHGKGHGHYVSREGGRQMLVLERSQGERIRINDTTEVVVLEIHPDHVKVAIDSAAGDATKPQG